MSDVASVWGMETFGVAVRVLVVQRGLLGCACWGAAAASSLPVRGGWLVGVRFYVNVYCFILPPTRFTNIRECDTRVCRPATMCISIDIK